jgi:hypothetical protein
MSAASADIGRGSAWFHRDQPSWMSSAAFRSSAVHQSGLDSLTKAGIGLERTVICADAGSGLPLETRRPQFNWYGMTSTSSSPASSGELSDVEHGSRPNGEHFDSYSTSENASFSRVPMSSFGYEDQLYPASAATRCALAPPRGVFSSPAGWIEDADLVASDHPRTSNYLVPSTTASSTATIDWSQTTGYGVNATHLPPLQPISESEFCRSNVTADVDRVGRLSVSPQPTSDLYYFGGANVYSSCHRCQPTTRNTCICASSESTQLGGSRTSGVLSSSVAPVNRQCAAEYISGARRVVDSQPTSDSVPANWHCVAKPQNKCPPVTAVVKPSTYYADFSYGRRCAMKQEDASVTTPPPTAPMSNQHPDETTGYKSAAVADGCRQALTHHWSPSEGNAVQVVPVKVTPSTSVGKH